MQPALDGTKAKREDDGEEHGQQHSHVEELDNGLGVVRDRETGTHDLGHAMDRGSDQKTSLGLAEAQRLEQCGIDHHRDHQEGGYGHHREESRRKVLEVPYAGEWLMKLKFAFAFRVQPQSS